MPRPHPLLAAALLLSLPGLQACKSKDANAEANSSADKPSSDSSGMALPVAGAPVRRGDLILSVVTTGMVRSDATAPLKAETQGTIAEVLVRPGDRVRKGQVLARLDPRPFDLAVAQAQADVERAEVQYRNITVPDSTMDPDGMTPERRQSALASSGLSGARVGLQKAKLDRERAEIVAPFDGVVDRVDVAAGTRVSAGQDIATVVDLSNLQIEAQVLEHDLPLIRVGGQAVITTAAAPDRPVIGRVAAVLPIIDTVTRAGRVLIRANVAGTGVLRPGMYADVRLEANRLRDRIIVPARAIIERDGRPLVFVVRNDRAQWVYIQPGLSNGSETEVLPDSVTGEIPVKEGDIVLVSGHLTLTHDAPVRVVSEGRDEQ
ncbi:MAG: efflux RND transporter periplasmic adaptor subunit [Gemmatimonadales bacterium]